MGMYDLYTPAEAAALFRVDPKTVTRWAKDGKIPSVKTPGGQRRFPKDVVHKLLQNGAGDGQDHSVPDTS